MYTLPHAHRFYGRNQRLVRTLAAVAAALGLALTGIGVGNQRPFSSVPNALAAACQTAPPGCGLGDTTVTAVNTVYHQHASGSPNVEPDSGESWNITSYWNTAIGTCFEYAETPSADVGWNGGAVSFQLSSESTTTNINDIEICTFGTCSVGDGGYAYRLYVDVEDDVAIAAKVYNLRQVVF